MDRQDIVRKFHELYYYDGEVGGTWANTSWLGVPTGKCPLDLWVYQEIIHEVQPELIIECGTSAGGSALFLASLCETIGRGQVVTIDIWDRALIRHTRVSRIIGSSIDPRTVEQVKPFLRERAPVMVILDSDHSAEHVSEELRLYSVMVTPGSYLIVDDTNVNGHPVLPFFGPGPLEAVQAFLRQNSDFEIDRTREKFLMTFNPSGYLKRKS